MLQSLQVSIDWNIEETIRRTQPEKLYIFVCCGFLSPPSSKTLWILILFSIVNCAAEYHTCSSLYLFFKAVSSSYIISPLSQTTTEKCSYNFGFPSSNEKSLFFPPIHFLIIIFGVVVVVVGICRRRAEWCVLPCRAPCRNRNRGWRRCWNPTCPVRRLTGS